MLRSTRRDWWTSSSARSPLRTPPSSGTTSRSTPTERTRAQRTDRTETPSPTLPPDSHTTASHLAAVTTTETAEDTEVEAVHSRLAETPRTMLLLDPVPPPPPLLLLLLLLLHPQEQSPPPAPLDTAEDATTTPTPPLSPLATTASEVVPTTNPLTPSDPEPLLTTKKIDRLRKRERETAKEGEKASSFQSTEVSAF